MLALWLWTWTALAQDVIPEVESAAEDAEEATTALAEIRALLDRQAEQLAGQEEALSEQRRRIAEQQDALQEMGDQLAKTKLRLIPKDEVRVDIEGHYRLRGYVYNHLFANQTDSNGDYRDARVMRQRLWLRPVFRYKELASLHVEARALDDIVVGDNMSRSSTALFTETPSYTNMDGLEQPSIEVARAWMEFKVPIGLLKIGRQPAHWGMGLLANDGEQWNHNFGESTSRGSINDRVMFATRPIALMQAITGRPDTDVPFFTAIAVDRLVEQPLYKYYGYRCSPGQTQGQDGYDARCDSNNDGTTDLDHGYTDETRQPSQRGQDWWADQNDDVMQMIYVAAYRGEGIDYLGGTGDLTAGVWAVHRKQRETESNILITDFYFKSFVHSVLLEGEVVRIAGTTRAITLPGSINQDGDPLRKKANITGYATRAGYVRPGWKAVFEHGMASGDDRVADANFSGRPLHPDHNVGLLLYQEVLSRVTAQLWTDSARGLWSQGGVYNSRYVFPTFHVYPMENWELLAGFVMAWPHKPDGALIRCRDSDRSVDCTLPASQQATAGPIGWEVDVGVKHKFHEHILLSLEGGMARATDRLPLEAVGLNPEGKFFTVQSRVAWIF